MQYDIALIAHDGKKPEMVNFVMKNKTVLHKANLIATGTTGSHLEAAGFSVKRMLSGPKGGDAQIAALLAAGELEMVIFFRDPWISIHMSPMCRC